MCGGGLQRAQQPSQLLPASPVRHPRRVVGSGGPRAAPRLVFSRPGFESAANAPSRPIGVHRVPQTDLDEQRLNKEIPRRTGVVGIFTDRDALLRPVGAALAEQHDDWAESRRYPDPDVLSKSCAEKTSPTGTGRYPRGTDRLSHCHGAHKHVVNHAPGPDLAARRLSHGPLHFLNVRATAVRHDGRFHHQSDSRIR